MKKDNGGGTASKAACKATSIGGQALIEGIMMKGPQKTSISVRVPDKSISTTYMPETRLKDKYKILGVPIIRGVANFGQSMVSGYKALMFAADKSGFTDLEQAEEERQKIQKEVKKLHKKGLHAEAKRLEKTLIKEQEDKSAAPEAAVENAQFSGEGGVAAGLAETVLDPAQEETAASSNLSSEELTQDAAIGGDQADLEKDEKLPVKTETTEPPKKEVEKQSLFMTVLMGLSMVLGVGLALVLFMWLPTFLFNTVNGFTGDMISNWRSVFEGFLKMGIFVGYIAAVALMKDIKRVFMYHGAEHKSIFCYESGEPLTVENVRKQRRFHPRCGTSFMILMLIISIMISAVLSIAFPVLTEITAVWIGIKILMLPLICGIGYELIKFCGRHNNLLTRIISAPGMWLQRLTTKEPEDEMIEVAIAALTAVIPDDPDADRW